MKRQYAAFYALMLVALSACQSLGVATPATFNERLAAGYVTTTGARDATATLLTSGKISAPEAQQIQSQLDNARTGLDLAREIHATNPPAGDAKLDAVVIALTALRAYLQTRTKGDAP